MKRLVIFLVLLIFVNRELTSRKLVVTDNTDIARNIEKSRIICNLIEKEIFQLLDFQVIDDFIIIGNGKPSEIVKMSLSGKILNRSGDKEGRGPGEFIWCVSPRRVGNAIAFIDVRNKLLFYDLDLNFIREIKFPIIARDFLYIPEKDCMIFPENSGSSYYLGFVDMQCSVKQRAGKKIINYKDKLSYLNKVFWLAYDKKTKTIWADMGRNYELRSYSEDSEANIIKSSPGFFKEFQAIDKSSGEKYTDLDGKGIKLIVLDRKLLYFFQKKEACFCDVVDLEKFKYLFRYRMDRNYRVVSYYKGTTFFGMSLSEDGDPIISRFEVKNR